MNARTAARPRAGFLVSVFATTKKNPAEGGRRSRLFSRLERELNLQVNSAIRGL